MQGEVYAMKKYIGGYKIDQNRNMKCIQCGANFVCNLCNPKFNYDHEHEKKPFSCNAICPDCSKGGYRSCWNGTPGFEEWKRKWNIET